MLWIFWVSQLSVSWYNIHCSQLMSQFGCYQFQMVSRLWITVAGIWVFPWQACISASFTHLDAVLLPFAVDALGFRSLSEGITSHVFVSFL